MGFFFNESSKKIDHHELDKLLRGAGLGSEHREHVKSKFEGKNKIDMKDVKDVVKELKDDTNDGINPQAADKIHNQFKEHLEPPHHDEPPTIEKPKF